MKIEMIKTFDGVVGMRSPMGDPFRGPKMFLDRGKVELQRDEHTNIHHLCFISKEALFEPALVLPLTMINRDQMEIKIVHDKKDKSFKRGQLKLLTIGPIDTRYYTGCEEIILKLGVNDASMLHEAIIEHMM
jgi:hypothetical protein